MQRVAEPILVVGAGAVLWFGLSAPLALALGLLLAVLTQGAASQQSAGWSKGLLQWGIVGLGFAVPLNLLGSMGAQALLLGGATVALVLAASLGLGRLLGVPPVLRWLHASGAAICGGSAIAAVGGATKAPTRDVSVALAVVFALNAVAVFVFPWLGHEMSLGQEQFGIWAALAIHDTASVAAAASAFGPHALTTATVWKLSRAIWIVPVAWLAARQAGFQGGARLPWFIGGFVAAVLLRAVFGPSLQLFAEAGQLAIVAAIFFVGASWRPGMFGDVRPRHLAQPVLVWVALAGLSLLAIVWL